MKLPTDRNERIKIFALAALGAVLILFGLFAGVVQPIRNGKRTSIEKIEALKTKIEKANRAISRMPKDERESEQVLRQLEGIISTRTQILEDRLGNFLLGASEIIEEHARQTGISIESVHENGISQIPQPASRKTPSAFNAYTVTVRMLCGTHDLLRFLHSIETANPYLCVSSLAIQAQQSKPDQHQITLEIQWPIWTDPKTPTLLDQQIRAIEEDKTSRVKAAPDAQAAEEGEGQP